MEEKLVRDNISEFSELKADGRKFRKAPIAEQLYFLSSKIKEEACEVVDAMYNETSAKVIEELADVLEVMEAICVWRGITMEEVRKIQEQKRNKKGGFNTFTVMELTNE